MKKAIIKFLLGDVPFWRFWDPRSGLAGGLIAGTVLVVIAVALIVATNQ